MKKLINLLAVPLLALASCGIGSKSDPKIIEAIKSKAHATDVTITHGVEANTNGFTGKKKEILVTMGDSTSTEKLSLFNIAYHVADTAYQIDKSQGEAAGLYRIQVKAGGLTTDFFDYKAEYLAKDQMLWGKINQFMDAVVAHRYDDFPKYMEPGLDMTSFIEIFKNADKGGIRVTAYRDMALQQTMGVHNPDKKPMQVIEGWVVMAAQGKYYPMMFVVNPATNQLSSVYLNPGKKQPAQDANAQ